MGINISQISTYDSDTSRYSLTLRDLVCLLYGRQPNKAGATKTFGDWNYAFVSYVAVNNYARAKYVARYSWALKERGQNAGEVQHILWAYRTYIKD